MEYLIRDFQETDIYLLVDLCAKHAAHETSKYNRDGKVSLLKSALLSHNPTLHCWIVMVEDEMAGYATFTFDFSTWEVRHYLRLDCIYLEEKFRGLGIGTEMMKRLMKVARERDCVNLQWQTPVFNETAIRFYERMGGKGLLKKRFFISI